MIAICKRCNNVVRGNEGNTDTKRDGCEWLLVCHASEVDRPDLGLELDVETLPVIDCGCGEVTK